MSHSKMDEVWVWYKATTTLCLQNAHKIDKVDDMSFINYGKEQT